MPGPIVIPIRYDVTGTPLAGHTQRGRLAEFAEGGVIRSFASGGKEKHVAEIASPDTVRMWAEPETGGEAYIPLSPAKRERSTAILSSVAKTFGSTLVPYDARAAQQSRPQVVEVNRGPLIGELHVAVTSPQASAAEIVDEAMWQVGVAARTGLGRRRD